MTLRILFVLSIFIFFSCSSTTLLDQGLPDMAYHKALNNISNDKAVSKNRKVLQSSLDKLFIQLMSTKIALLNSGELESMEQALAINQKVQNYIINANKYLIDDYDSRIERLRTEESQLIKECANRNYIEGKSKFETAQADNNKLLAKEAYVAFQKAIEYGHEEQNSLASLLESSYELAQIIYVLDPKDYDPSFLKWRESNDQFVKILSRDQISKSSCDCIIAVEYESPITVDNSDVKTRNHSRTIRVQPSTKTVTKYRTNAQGQVESFQVTEQTGGLETVNATVESNEKKRFSRMTANLKITSKTKNCSLADKSVFADIENSSGWSHVNGDVRALPSNNQPMGDATNRDTRSELEEQLYADLRELVYQYIAPEK